MRFLERSGCHLCEEAWSLLVAMDATEGVERVDVDDDEALLVAYGLRIPVLVDDRGRVLAEGIFSEPLLRAALDR